ncbi:MULTISPECIES: ABC transporter ATP-binding protein [Bacillales]|jgi:ABC-2 type transport system ATP-binding protein|uniref:ABC transporter ATP-binding protein n=2 Tax=Bacillales TaxID=1385 RepID=A0A8I1DGU1_THEIN|nr:MULTISPECIES: ABC transporter ATP-binding protein [Bacillales]MBA4549912.1 ABC transporter ATP-binding protein [Thermoactinomyces intermedius]MBA4837748.1 ABC transporter ATP-binding protein [Thermoactinomyces intermedius]MBH8596236.1 ABC transporter ATP-binding protein [Thermoactinomyces intermedius]MBH8602578.1 ABC transporter ATP-binding protein [Thermoactinomyces sp. CICC 23799]NNU88919.1 ABC transporter ATP-binding protein [Geobacillus sp. MR]
MKAVLEVNNLKKELGSFSLEQLTFSLKEGCITGFIGVNGSGKTTTIKTILGLYPKDDGSIKFFGKEIEKNEYEIKNRIGVVLDEGYFYEEMTLKEMKSIIAPAYTNWDESVFLNYINRFNLKLDQKIATLSKGMRMKFAITLALSHHADLLIMDEPTSGLDPLIRNELMEILLDFMEEEGKSVFFSTHITSDLEKVADMLILIDNGEIVFNESKDELLERHALIKGDNSLINEHSTKLFLRLRQTPFGFQGITNKVDQVCEQMKDIIIERPTIEDVMLAYVKEG